jgi:hypothetical protein
MYLFSAPSSAGQPSPVDADIEQVSKQIADLQTKSKELDTSTKTYLNEARKEANRVKQSGEDIKAFMDELVKKRLDEIKATKAEKLEESRARKMRIDAALEEMEKFRARAQEAKCKTLSGGVVGTLRAEAGRLTSTHGNLAAELGNGENLVFKSVNFDELLLTAFMTKTWTSCAKVARKKTRASKTGGLCLQFFISWSLIRLRGRMAKSPDT